MNVVTRSGRNAYHGDGYFYFRDHNMAAYPDLVRNPLNPNPFFARRNPGSWVGGPVKKDKLFFFFNYEYMNQVQALAIKNPDQRLPWPACGGARAASTPPPRRASAPWKSGGPSRASRCGPRPGPRWSGSAHGLPTGAATSIGRWSTSNQGVRAMPPVRVHSAAGRRAGDPGLDPPRRPATGAARVPRWRKRRVFPPRAPPGCSTRLPGSARPAAAGPG